MRLAAPVISRCSSDGPVASATNAADSVADQMKYRPLICGSSSGNRIHGAAAAARKRASPRLWCIAQPAAQSASRMKKVVDRTFRKGAFSTGSVRDRAMDLPQDRVLPINRKWRGCRWRRCHLSSRSRRAGRGGWRPGGPWSRPALASCARCSGSRHTQTRPCTTRNPRCAAGRRGRWRCPGPGRPRSGSSASGRSTASAAAPRSGPRPATGPSPAPGGC